MYSNHPKDYNEIGYYFINVAPFLLIVVTTQARPIRFSQVTLKVPIVSDGHRLSSKSAVENLIGLDGLAD